jgi:hypothetical protein
VSLRTFVYQADLGCARRLIGSKSAEATNKASKWLDKPRRMDTQTRANAIQALERLVSAGISYAAVPPYQHDSLDLAVIALVLGGCPSRIMLDDWKAEAFAMMSSAFGEGMPSSTVARYWDFLTFGRRLDETPGMPSSGYYGYLLHSELGEFYLGLQNLPLKFIDKLGDDLRLLLEEMTSAARDVLAAKLDIFSLTD